MIHEVELPGENAETRALEGIDRSSDGTLGFSRAQSAENELVRDGAYADGTEMAGDSYFNRGALHPVEFYPDQQRKALLDCAATAPPLLRNWSITPLDDRLIVEYASHKEGYVCESCGGAGHCGYICADCSGSRTTMVKPGRFEPCDACRIVGADGHEPFVSGFAPCGACKGSGLAAGVLAMPDTSKQDHSYGDILSVGQSVMDLRPGDRVVFSKMAGIYLKGDTRNCCLLRRGEIMGFMLKK